MHTAVAELYTKIAQDEQKKNHYLDKENNLQLTNLLIIVSITIMSVTVSKIGSGDVQRASLSTAGSYKI